MGRYFTKYTDQNSPYNWQLQKLNDLTQSLVTYSKCRGILQKQ